MDRILEVLRRSRDWVGADVLAAFGEVNKYRVGGFVKVLRGEGFTVEYSKRWERDPRNGVLRMVGYYLMREE